MTSNNLQTSDIERYVKKSSFLLVIDSRNAEVYNNSTKLSDVSFDIKYPIQMPKDCIYMTWVVNSFTCPVSWYLINDTNDTLSLFYNNTMYHLKFKHGNYTASSFMKQFLLTVPIGFNISMDPQTNQFTITYNMVFTIYPCTLLSILGGLNDSQHLILYSSNNNNSLTMPYPCNFAGLNSFNIKCNNIRTNNLDSFDKLSTSSVIASVPVNASQNGIIYYEKRNDFEFEVKENIIESLDISLEDDLGNFINFNNQHWNLVIQVNYIIETYKDITTSFNDILNYGYNQ